MNKLLVFGSLAVIAGVVVTLSAQVSDAAPPPVVSAPHGAMSVSADGVVSPHGVASSAMPADHSKAIPSDTKLVNSGKVLEVIESPAYTFLNVSSEKGPVWLAAYKTEIAKGDAVKYSNGIAMPKFHSKSLDRTFDMIVFVDTLERVKK